MDHTIDFHNGHLYCQGSEHGQEEDLYSTYDIFKAMKDYYSKQCVVRHWIQETIESGKFVESTMSVGSAIWQMKEHYLEQATFTLCD